MSRSKLLIGLHAIIARLRHGARSIGETYFRTNRRDRRMQNLLRVAEAADVCLIPAGADRLHGITGTDRHQGVVTKAESLSSVLSPDKLLDGIEGMPLLLMLGGVTDPYNLGTCLRVAGAAGAHAVIAPKDHSIRINTAIAKVASGAAKTVSYIIATNPVRMLRKLQERGVWAISTADEAEQDLYQADFKGSTVIVMDTGGEGTRRLTCEMCGVLVSIPMAEDVESLNVSVASGVCLFETVRQRAAALAKK